MRRKARVVFMAVGMSLILMSCRDSQKSSIDEMAQENTPSEETLQKDISEPESTKDYDLPVSQEMREEAEEDCIARYQEMKDVLEGADHTEAILSLSVKEATDLQEILGESGNPVTFLATETDMVNYERMDEFLKACQAGETAEIVAYEVYSNGGLGRTNFSCKNGTMEVLITNTLWNTSTETPVILSTTRAAVVQWNYYESGWFSYEIAVPEEPEVTETVNGNYMMRVLPQKEEYRELAKNYLIPIGYLGNNLFSVNWSGGNMADVDFNGVYEYLYVLDTGEAIDRDSLTDGVPAEVFENLVMKYLPVTAEDLRKYADYDVTAGEYSWKALGCGNYSPNDFGTSFPEITEETCNEDGSITLTVHAVCENAGTDNLFTHKITIEINDAGNVKYIANEVTSEEQENLPVYEYRTR